MKKLTEENEKETKPKKTRIKKVVETVPEKSEGEKTKQTSIQDTKENTSDADGSKVSTKTSEVIDATKDQKTVEPKKDNTRIWALAALLVTVLIAYLINKKNEETN